MKITVILCTYNRHHLLEKALNSISAQSVPASIEWEVLVVDNNSSDQTRRVVERFYRQCPARFRYLFEPQTGKSHALNAGIGEARGDVVAFLDDDVTADPTWLENLTAPLHNPEWAGSGGRILPVWTSAPPRWISTRGRYGLAPLAMFDLGEGAGELAEPPFGTNMAFRKELFQKYGGFRTDLGPRPGSEIRNEDTEFGRRLMLAGERLRYVPSAVVHHYVPPQRLEKKYFLSWWFDKGRADIREYGIPWDTTWFAGGIPLYLCRRVAVWTLRWMVTLEPAQRFSCQLKTWTVVGSIVECRRQSREAK